MRSLFQGILLSIVLISCGVDKSYATDTLNCTIHMYKVKPDCYILPDEGYSHEFVKTKILNDTFLQFVDVGKLTRSFKTYWVAAILKNDSEVILQMHAEGYILQSWLDDIPSTNCGEVPCEDPRGVMVQKHNLISHFDLPPGSHLFIAKIGDFHLPKDIRPVISSSVNFDSKVVDQYSGNIFFYSFFAGMVLLLSIISILLYVRLKDKAFLFYAIYCFLLFYNAHRVLAETYEFFHYAPVYIPWVYSKMFLAIAFFTSYAYFGAYFIDAKEKYPHFFRIVKWYVYVCLASLIPEIILLSMGQNAMSYSYYFVMRMMLGLVGLCLNFIVFKHRKDIYVVFVLLGSTFLLFGEITSSLVDRSISSIIASAGAIIDLAIFSFGLAYRIHKFNESKLEVETEVLYKTNEIAELNLEKSTLNMNLLQAQMNPHFIFNALNSINRYILKADKEKASYYLSLFSKLIRFNLDHSTQSIVPLSEEITALKLYIDLEKIRFSNRFEFEIDVDKNINLENTFLPPLIIQPFVENSILHGFMTKEGPCKLDILVSSDKRLLSIEIIDNGIGRVAASSLSKLQTHESKGLKITLDRITSFSKLHGCELDYQIIDLYNEYNKPIGTKVILKMPYLFE